MSGPLKKSTLLAGLHVANDPKRILGVLYAKILRVLCRMPPDSMYRRYTEEIVANRAAVVQEAATVTEIEERIDCGQAEELIVQAEKELALARKMAEWKPWEPLTEHPPPDQWNWPPTKL